ncbi:contactin-1-like [Styela clava]
MVGEDIEIDCTATGYPLPNVTWHRDRHPVPSNTDDVFQTAVLGKSTLRIKNANLRDTNRYRCFAENVHTKAETKAYLDIRVHPHELTRIVDGNDSPASRNLYSSDEISLPSDQVIQPHEHTDVPANSWMISTIFGINIAVLFLLMVLVYSK